MNPRTPEIFRGSLVALPTPFAGGRIDHPALIRLIERQIEGGSAGLVIAGSTGEGPALSRRERHALFEFCAGVAGDRIPTIAGIGAGSTSESVALARSAELAGARGILASTPAYSRPTPRGLEEHFARIATSTSLPIALYNIPGRTGVDLLPETVQRIAAEHANVVAIKEASGSLERLRELREIEGLAVLTGDDHLIVDALELGVAGVIGVVANLAPARVRAIVDHFGPDGRLDEVPALVETLTPLVRALACEPNPAPLKAAFCLMGLCTGELRLPLVPVTPENQEFIRAAIVHAGLA